MNFIITEIQPHDNGVLQELIVEVLRGFGISGPGFACNDPELSDLHAFYNTMHAQYFCAKINGEIVGGAGIAPLSGADKEICELQKMYILNEFRGIGMGKQLMNHCLAFAREQGYKRCYLETVEQMKPAQALYLRSGFNYISERMGDTGHSGCPVFMLKEL